MACSSNPSAQTAQRVNSSSVTPASTPNNFTLRFRWQSGRYISLNEEGIAHILRVNLSDYQFPDDYPFTIRENRLYLKVTIEGEPTLFIETDFNQDTISNYCTLNPELEKLLCEIPSSNNIGMSEVTSKITEKRLTEETEKALIAQVSRYALEKDFFIIQPVSPEIYVLPREGCGYCDFIFKTWCRWVTKDEIQCLTSHGTGIWGTARFSLRTKLYIPLPDEGANIWNLGHFQKGYIQPKSWSNEIAVYNLKGALVYESVIEDWLTTDDSTVLFTEHCGTGFLCFHQLKMGQEDIQQKLQAKLNISEINNERCHSYVSHTSDVYLITFCNRVFVITKDTLEIIHIFELAQDELQDNLFAVHKYNQFLVVTDNRPSFYEDEIYSTNGAKVFDLNKCQDILDTSCIAKVWDKLLVADDSGIYLTPQEIKYSPLDAPNLIFITNEDAKSLTIYNLDNNTENRFTFENIFSFP